MATTIAKIFRGENGQNHPFRIVNEAGAEQDLSLYNVSESTIVIKDPEDLDTTVLTITDTDITFSSPNVVWVPTDAQITTLSLDMYNCYIHLVNVSTTLETISRHYIRLVAA